MSRPSRGQCRPHRHPRRRSANPCVVPTAAAARPAVVCDHDRWNRYRTIGESTPPYPLP
ncbi:DUF4873 domain-containing protein [Nocardia sp. NPDC006044]|uniref:DUF4873 domain-containing protein n=1 Tax=Nocardia sp. NPDC006044 TaxID=3364306 RepID=UPI0036BB1DB2